LAYERFDNAPFSLLSNRRCGRQKMSRRRGMGARWRGSGHGYYFLLRNFYRGEAEKLLTRVGYLLSRPRGGLKTATRALVK